MKVTVDRNLCESNAKCVEACPEVFAVDDEDDLQILMAEIPAQLSDKVRKAVNRCPRLALSLQE